MLKHRHIERSNICSIKSLFMNIVFQVKLSNLGKRLAHAYLPKHPPPPQNQTGKYNDLLIVPPGTKKKLNNTVTGFVDEHDSKEFVRKCMAYNFFLTTT